jgi:ABC-type nitrate/sulfonate/bicarbonate transport system substrate-binding protein
VAAHTDWIEQNQAIIPRLYATYQQAADWIKQNPDEAAALIAPKASAEDRKAMAELVRSNERLGMHVAPAAGMRNEIAAVYQAGRDVGYFPKAPSGDSVYTKAIP